MGVGGIVVRVVVRRAVDRVIRVSDIGLRVFGCRPYIRIRIHVLGDEQDRKALGY